MKTVFIAMMLFSSASTYAETANLSQLRDLCVPSAPLVTLAAIVSTESGGTPNAIQLDFPHSLLRRWQLAPGTLRLIRQPKSATEALEWIDYLNARRVSVDVGLMQVSTDEATRRHILPAALLDPCTNVQTGWAILSDDYQIEVRTYGSGQAALQHALSRYNTGDTNRGIENGYLARVITAVKRLTGRPDPNQLRNDQRPGGQK
jgi:type IV secretion system protein VirB1